MSRETTPTENVVAELRSNSTLGLSVYNLLKLTFARDPKAEVKVAGSCGVALLLHLEAHERALFEDAKAYAEAAKLQRLRAEAAEARVTALEAEIARLRVALEWYAGDGSTYDGIDVGQRARQALSRSTEKNDG